MRKTLKQSILSGAGRTNRFGPGLVLLAFLAFISIGLPDGLLGVAWPSMRATFLRPLDAVALLLLSAMAGYLISSFLSGAIINRTSTGILLAASCLLTGGALMGYALASYWWMMVLCAFCAGIGSGAIDAGINNYVEENYGKRLMQWLHASYGVGITLGPFIMTAGINRFNSWRLGYMVVGFFQLILAVLFFWSIPLWRKGARHQQRISPKMHQTRTVPIWNTVQQGSVWVSMMLFFFYAGAEATLGMWAYTVFTESRGIHHELAGTMTGLYWASFTVGRFAAGFITRHFRPYMLIRSSFLMALGSTLLLCWRGSALLSVVSVVLTGFAIAPVYPALVSETSDRVSGRHKAHAIGLQIGAAGLGATLLSGWAGVLARQLSLEIIPVYMIILFLILIGLYELAVRRQKAEI